MSKALDRINKIVTKETSSWLDDANQREVSRAWFYKSAKIAIRILREIRAQKPINGMSQKKLAEALEVSPQYINKVIKGQENLTLETIDKIEKALGITLFEIPTSESINTVQSSNLAGIISVNRNLSLNIGSTVTIDESENWSEYEPEYIPNGTYG